MSVSKHSNTDFIINHNNQMLIFLLVTGDHIGKGIVKGLRSLEVEIL